MVAETVLNTGGERDSWLISSESDQSDSVHLIIYDFSEQFWLSCFIAFTVFTFVLLFYCVDKYFISLSCRHFTRKINL